MPTYTNITSFTLLRLLNLLRLINALLGFIMESYGPKGFSGWNSIFTVGHLAWCQNKYLYVAVNVGLQILSTCLFKVHQSAFSVIASAPGDLSVFEKHPKHLRNMQKKS